MGAYLVCPDCGKRGVTLRERRDESHYGCRYCDWYVFVDGDDQIDRQRRIRLTEANPDANGLLRMADQ